MRLVTRCFGGQASCLALLFCGFVDAFTRNRRQKLIRYTHKFLLPAVFCFATLCIVAQIENRSIPGESTAFTKTHPLSGVGVFSTQCSHQESNLDRGYRKPIFYPLNYESDGWDNSIWFNIFPYPFSEYAIPSRIQRIQGDGD